MVGGQEDRAAALIAKIAQGAVEDCFVPMREVTHRKSGQWRRTLEKLFPGYVFVQTGTPEQVREALGRVPAFTRMLTSAGDTCLPLTADEVAWINAITNVDTHVMEMSEGVIEGDRVMVIRGPLRGCEARITRIDRHKRLAWVDMDMFGRNKTIRVGWDCGRFPVHPTPAGVETRGTRRESSTPAPARSSPSGTTASRSPGPP